MAKLVFDEEFLRGWADVQSPKLADAIDRMLELIAMAPGVGSSITRDSVKLTYGPRVLKALVDPYQIIYEYDRDNDTVYVYGLLYSKSVV